MLKGVEHVGPVTGLDFDPKDELLASLDSTGTVCCWELSTGVALYTLMGVAPYTGFNTFIVINLRWSLDGRFLAVPGLNKDVLMYDRITGDMRSFLTGDDHAKNICYLTWAPNGKYIATSSLDKKVLIWDVDKKEVIVKQNFEQRISCMAWKPNGNALSVIDDRGRYGLWESVILLSMTYPTVGIPTISIKSNDDIVVPDDEIGVEQLAGANGALVDSGSGESQHTSRKRSRPDDDDRDANEVSRVKNKQCAASGGLKSIGALTNYKMQSPFQPGAIPPEPGKQTFLCFNVIGWIRKTESVGISYIEVDFHDTRRIPEFSSMIDYYGFTMVSINENGCVFANTCKGEEDTSVLMYRPFIGWQTNSEKMRFDEGEEVKIVAHGSSWVAAVTSLNLLRIFSEGGLQKHVLSLDGPVVSAVGFKDQLAVVYHVLDCLPSNEQVMEFRVFNMSRKTQQLKGRVALTPGWFLTWI